MEYSNTFYKEVSDLQARVINAIEANLKRIDRTLSADDKEPLEFFSHKIIDELNITGINFDGTLLGQKSSIGRHTEGTIRNLIEDDVISLNEAVSLLEDLEQI